MTTTTLTAGKELVMAPQTGRRTIREVVGWNHRATVYYTAVAAACIVLTRVHP